MEIVLIVALLIVWMYMFYSQGLMFISSKYARKFILLRGKDGCSISFSRCTGRVKRIIRYKKAVELKYSINGEIAKGVVKVLVKDMHKNIVLQLDNNTRMGTIPIDKGKKYYIEIIFKGATGRVDIIYR